MICSHCVALNEGQSVRLCYVEEPQNLIPAPMLCSSLGMELLHWEDQDEMEVLLDFIQKSKDFAVEIPPVGYEILFKV